VGGATRRLACARSRWAVGRGDEFSGLAGRPGDVCCPGARQRCVIGTSDRGLQRLQGGRIEEWPLVEGSGGRAVRSLLTASRGDLWIAMDSPSRLLALREGAFRSLKLPERLRSIRHWLKTRMAPCGWARQTDRFCT